MTIFTFSNILWWVLLSHRYIFIHLISRKKVFKINKFGLWTTLFWVQFLKTFFNIDLVQLQTYTTLKCNICENIFYSLNCDFTRYHLASLWDFFEHNCFLLHILIILIFHTFKWEHCHIIIQLLFATLVYMKVTILYNMSIIHKIRMCFLPH